MEHNTTIKLTNDQAFVAFSKPGGTNYELHICHHCLEELSDKNLGIYDFVAMPFVDNLGLNSFFKYKESFLNSDFSFHSSLAKDFNITSKEAYISDVSNLINTIKHSNLDKAIYSRKIVIDRPAVDIGSLFKEMCIKYPNTFTFLFNIPNVGCWLGASPELLIRQNGKELETVALAGTQKLVGNIEEITWGEKEVDEQAYIKTFIKKVFKEEGIEYTEFETLTKAAGNVCHIHTAFNSALPNSMSKLIKKLHPGPAISGSPKHLAIDTIKDMERHNRGFYTGYLGDISNGNVELYINLRSMEALKDKFLLYVGGGITADSVPEDEWTETELKAMTMSSVIK